MRLTLAVTLVAAGAITAQTGKRGVTPEDYFLFENITDVRISPDGRLAAYVVTSVDQKANRRRSSIWLASLDGRMPPRQFTSGTSARAPRWSPDGQLLAFLSARTEGEGAAAKAQVHTLSMNGGEAVRVTNLAEGVEAFAWSPDGAHLACISKTEAPGAKPSKSDVRHYFSITYKFNDTGWFDSRRGHIFIVDAKSGTVRQITSGAERNDADPQWSPDGARLAFAAEETDKPLLESGGIYAVPANGGELARISDLPGLYRLPRWSPDGRRIAFSGSQNEAEMPKIRIAPAAGGKSVLASKKFDLSAADLDWPVAGDLYVEAGARGQAHLFRIDLPSQKIAQITTGERAIHHTQLHERARAMVYVANDSRHLDDLYVSDLEGRNERRLTRLNAALWDKLDLQAVERVPYRSVDGLGIDGFFLKPLGWQPGKSYPMVLVIHGGPASMYGMDWFHEFQVYAARGWAVFYANPRGSSGYGEKFQRAVEKEWGGKAYEDLMRGVDVVLEKYPWIDKERLGVTGGSYGGFMTNWIVGHTRRFKAAVTLRSISNFISDEGTRDAAYGHGRDFGGTLFENFDFYWNSSPLKYARNVTTPTLILHSDNDYRVPLEQGEQWFRALKHFGVTTELVIFPRENHNLTRNGEPKHLVESLNWQIYWFDRFLNGNQSAVPPDK
jgi:dipeptidyl aminopeptidase/acylaminoacyl peptidase